jgi:hypothetical protein
MRNKRKAALFLTDNRIPVYEGDIVKVFTSKTGVHWHPRSCDYKTPDTTRLRGKPKYLSLGQNEHVLLESTQRLKRGKWSYGFPYGGCLPGGYKEERL